MVTLSDYNSTFCADPDSREAVRGRNVLYVRAVSVFSCVETPLQMLISGYDSTKMKLAYALMKPYDAYNLYGNIETMVGWHL